MSHVDKLSGAVSGGAGKTALLILLFLLGVAAFCSLGLVGLVAVCALPALGMFILLSLRYTMTMFWVFFVVNFFIFNLQFNGLMPLPISGVAEIFYITLMTIALIDAKDIVKVKLGNAMFAALALWWAFCTLEILNDTCDLGIDVAAWFVNVRVYAFQMMYAYLVCIIFINTPERLHRLLTIWGVCCLISAAWCWKQMHLGFTPGEYGFLMSKAHTHIVHGVIRYFSTFSDAASCGCSMSASAILFLVLALTQRTKRLQQVFYLIVGLACIWTFFNSGTRTAIITFLFGAACYIVLSKSFKIAIPFGIAGVLLYVFLAFTMIGNANPGIRRMRSAFNKDDASMNIRDINKAAIKKYLSEAPWGVGIGRTKENIPAGHKYHVLIATPPDSEYVRIWQHTGNIGLVVFCVCIFTMWLGGCWIVFFRLRDPLVRGIGAAFCCAFADINLGGYANQILLQYPNVLLFFGGLGIVYGLPRMEPMFEAFEQKQREEEKERLRIKAEKKKKFVTRMHI